MALKQLIAACLTLEADRQRIDELKGEKERLQARIAAINAELPTVRADADAQIVIIRAEAPTVVSP